MSSCMVNIYGLTHIALAVKDAELSLRFYRKVFAAKLVYRATGFIQAQTPGTRDVLVFEENAPRTGKRGGIAHFGFRLTDPHDIETAAQAVRQAGGRISSKGEFCPGEPYLVFTDPDGYEIEIWDELPTPVDPTRENGVVE